MSVGFKMVFCWFSIPIPFTKSIYQSAISLIFLLCLLPCITTTKLQPYTPTDLILLNCGASSNTTSPDGRIWNSDAKSKFIVSNSETSSSAFRASQQDPSVTQVPYMTARIFNSTFAYQFPVPPGSKFVRLYFYPAAYSDLDIKKSFFSVEANNYTLVKNFSAFLTVSAIEPPVAFLKKEFIIHVWENQMLNITFNPSPSSFAFINGIEIVSMPNGLYASGDDNPLTYVGIDYPFYLDNRTALETFYRLNVGGQVIDGVNDTGMYRSWLDDSNYTSGGLVHKWRDDVTINYTEDTPAYTAPDVVYITKRTMGAEPEVNLKYNLTWVFPVDSGFNYLVRLHFCETEEVVNNTNPRVFSIFINNMTAELEANVIYWSGGNDIPIYKDYVVWVPEGSHGKQELWLALHPNTKLNPNYADAILNGLEMFKLNKSEGNLAGPNPELELVPAPTEQHPVFGEGTKRKHSSPVAAIVGAALGVIFTFSLLFFFIHRYKGKAKDGSRTKHKRFWLPFSHTSSSTTTAALSLPTDLCRKFTMTDIKAATRNFNDQNVIGTGGFGTVYKGNIENGLIPVAIKRLDSSSKQGTREFHAEIEMLSKLRHLHLVSLIGYCDDEGEMILVYEHLPNGNLQDHLYKTKNPPLPWKQRLKICIGAARGLHYLHTGTKHIIIHRDVKSSNILLDKNWLAKVSDFGLSKTGPTGEDQTHVSTVVRGSLGYLDPEYYRRQQLTEKSDVYSFGVVLLEVLCGRRPIISNLSHEQVNLVGWARHCYRRGTLDQIIDPHLKGDITSVCLDKFAEIADSCVSDKATERPSIGDVVWSLEFALQLQETAEKEVSDAGDAVSENQRSSSVPCREVITTDDDDLFTFSGGPMSDSRSTICTCETGAENNGPDRVRSGNVFSEIMNPQGR